MLLNSKYVLIIDSGVGGLTIAKNFKIKYPNISLVYFGDSKYFPYGDKSKRFINDRLYQILSYFSKAKNCLGVILACHSASVSIYGLDKQFYDIDFSKIINIIDPTVETIKNLNLKRVGLIGTNRTINSKIYSNIFNELETKVKFISKAAPKLAPMIEEGLLSQSFHMSCLEYYFKDFLNNIDCLVLGCTHYPIIKNEIAQYFQNKVLILDPSEFILEYFNKQIDFDSRALMTNSLDFFYVSSKISSKFVKIAQNIYNKDIKFEILENLNFVNHL